MLHSVCEYKARQSVTINIEPDNASLPNKCHIYLDREYTKAAGELVVKLVSVVENISVKEILKTTRGKADSCLIRQKAMYLLHTVFSCPYHRVAEFFGRDRTTVSHACRIVEDLRDNEKFDVRLNVIENLLVSALTLRNLEADQTNE